MSVAGIWPTVFATARDGKCGQSPARISSRSINDDYCGSVENCNSGGTRTRGVVGQSGIPRSGHRPVGIIWHIEEIPGSVPENRKEIPFFGRR